MDYMISIFILIGLALIVGFWLDSLKTREKALESAGHACERLHVQLLDETVTLKKLRFLPLFSGKGCLRHYTFEYSDGTEARLSSYLILQGKTVIEVGFFNTKNKVVPFLKKTG